MKYFFVNILIFYLINALFGKKYIRPYLAKRAMRFVEKKMQQQGQYSQPKPSNEGETIIDKKPTNTKSSNSSVGDYIDFEEIND